MAGAKLAATDYRSLRDLLKGRPYGIKIGHNTTAVMDDGDIVIRLHGSRIFKFLSPDEYEFTLAGWNTVTTRARINMLLPGHVSVYSRNRTPYAGMRWGSLELDSYAWYRVWRSPRGWEVQEVN